MEDDFGSCGVHLSENATAHSQSQPSMSPTCPNCQSESVIRYGYRKSGKQRWLCKNCSHSFCFGVSEEKFVFRLKCEECGVNFYAFNLRNKKCPKCRIPKFTCEPIKKNCEVCGKEFLTRKT